MLDAKELRIGNWLLINGGDDYSKPQEYEIDAIDIGVAVSSEKRFSPIPLTTEILIKCGFRLNEGKTKHWYHPTTMLFDLFNITALEDGFKIIAGRLIDSIIIGSSVQIEYLHQLQNLYFALTQKELEIKL